MACWPDGGPGVRGMHRFLPSPSPFILSITPPPTTLPLCFRSTQRASTTCGATTPSPATSSPAGSTRCAQTPTSSRALSTSSAAGPFTCEGGLFAVGGCRLLRPEMHVFALGMSSHPSLTPDHPHHPPPSSKSNDPVMRLSRLRGRPRSRTTRASGPGRCWRTARWWRAP